jgi:hypothetical protein
MRGIITLVLFIVALVGTIAALATFVYVESWESDDVGFKMEYGVSLFQKCVKTTVDGKEEDNDCDKFDYENCQATKGSFLFMTVVEFFVAVVCLVGIVLSVLEIMGRLGPRGLLGVSLLGSLMATAVWIAAVIGYKQNDVCYGGKVEKLPDWMRDAIATKWDENGSLGPNPILMICVSALLTVCIFIACFVRGKRGHESSPLL